jgi:hypothetical protein
VGHTFYFLTATWLAAQGADPKDIWTSDVSPSCGSQRASSEGYVHTVGTWDMQSSSGCGCHHGYSAGGYQEHHSFLERIQSRLSGLANLWPWKHQVEEGEIYQGEGAIVHTGSPGMPMPSARSSEPPLADAAPQPALRPPETPADFHPAPPASHGLVIEPEPN